MGSPLLKGFLESGWVEDLTWEATSYTDYGDAVIVRIQFAGQGRVSGLSFDAPVFQVLTFRDGEIVSVEDFSGARTRSVQPAADRGAES